MNTALSVTALIFALVLYLRALHLHHEARRTCQDPDGKSTTAEPAATHSLVGRLRMDETR